MGKKNNKTGHTLKQSEMAAARAAKAAKQENEKEKLTKKQKVIATVIAAVVAVAVVALIVILIASGAKKSKNSAAASGTDLVETVVTPLQGTGVEAESETDVLHHIEIDIKDYGVIYAELNETVAPVTVNQFITLAKSGFYDGLTFHRTRNGFMMQGGDPQGDGYGGYDVKIAGEFEANGYKNPISHKRGTLSMARANDYNSASCQFFIVHEDGNEASLDGKYAAFGHVTAGMEVVDEICESAVPIDNNGSIKAEEQPVINSITVID